MDRFLIIGCVPVHSSSFTKCYGWHLPYYLRAAYAGAHEVQRVVFGRWRVFVSPGGFRLESDIGITYDLVIHLALVLYYLPGGVLLFFF